MPLPAPPPDLLPADPVAAWNALVAAREARRAALPSPPADRWADRAADYDRRVRACPPDASNPVWHLLRSLLPEPAASATVLDIGAGTGRWTLPFAAAARRVTALEPSPSMRARLEENVARAGLRNVTVLPAAWPAAVPPHDLVLCAHAMYGAPDIARWIAAMNAAARAACAFYIRAPTPDDPLSAVSLAAFGTPHAVPDLQMALPVLAALGIQPEIHPEPPGAHPARVHPTRAAAEAWAVQRLHLPPEHHPLLRRVLDAALIPLPDGSVAWPPTNPAVLLVWHPR